MPSILKRGRALADLFLMGEQISRENPDAADRVLDQIDARLQLLATQPLMGRQRPELHEGLHSFVSGNYVIFYFPLDDGIDVVRVLDGRQDIDADLFS